MSIQTENECLCKNRLSRELINSFDLLRFEGRIHTVNDDKKLNKAVNKLSQFDILGFDTETKPSFKKGIVHPLSLIQFATNNDAYLIQLKHITDLNPLKPLLENSDIKKVGVGLRDDLKKMQELIEHTPQAFIDLSVIAKEKGIIQIGLRALSVRYLNGRISKTAQKSNWGADKLTDKQKVYAATDAWAALKIYDLINKDKTDYRQYLENEDLINQQSQEQPPSE